MNKEGLLYIIILNYNGWDETVQCIESVRKIKYTDYKILVIDNASDEVPAHNMRPEEIEYIRLNQNLGYAGGNNIGIEYAIRKGAAYICLMNNDIVVESNIFNQLIPQLDQPDTGVVGPATLFWKSDLIHSTGLKINFYTGTAKILNYKKKVKDIKESNIDCDYLEGTCLVFKASLIEQIGYLPEEYFLYFEETEWCCRIKREGLRVVCVPLANIWHKGSSSVNKISGLKCYFEDRNRILFEKRNAPAGAKIFFSFYFMVQFFYRIIRGKRNIRAFRAIMDGLSGRIDKKYF